jgi:hypothetical protein
VQEELVVNLSGFKQDENVSITLIDFLGREMQHAQAGGGTEVRMNIKAHEAGRYFLIISSGKKRFAKSIIKSL